MIADFYHEPFPLLDIDKHFMLREQHTRDTQAFFNYYSDPEVARHILATNPRNLIEAAAEIEYCRALFKNKQGIYWALACKKDDLMIGAIGLYINNSHHRAEICYDLSRSYWNQGIMTAGLKRVIHFSFQHITVHRIEAITLATNAASIALLKKLGFQHEGTLKNYRYFSKRSHDVELFALTPH